MELPRGGGGGIILDMLCHWRYVLDNLFGEVGPSPAWAPRTCQSVGTRTASHTGRRPTTRPTPPSSSPAASWPTSTPRGACASTATSSSNCRSTARRAARLLGCGTARPSTGRPPKAVWNPTCPTRTTIVRSGSAFRRTKMPTTPSRSSGRCSSGTFWPTNRSPTICSKARKACNSPSWACSWKQRRWLEVPELESSRTPQEELDHA